MSATYEADISRPARFMPKNMRDFADEER